MNKLTVSILSSLFLLHLVWCPDAAAQSNHMWNEARCQQLSSLLREMHKAKEFSGTVAIVENGSVKFNESHGYSNIETEEKLDDDASFRLASVSKQFTAMCIMILKERGKLDYDDSITTHLPSLSYDNITIRHLLNHTSGLPDYMLLMNRHWERGTRLDQRTVAFNKDIVAMLAEHQPDLHFEPGTKFAYSNTGYVLLGQIIEEASGQPVRKFFQQNIFKPLKMENSDVFDTSDDFAPQHRVYGFQYQKSEPGYKANDFHYLNGMIGDGGVYSSALDMVKWDQALHEEKLVKQSTLKEAFTSGDLNDGKKTDYGFGWSIDNKKEGQFQVSHGGGWVGFRTYIARNITEKRTLIILTNNSTNQLGKVLKGLSAIVNQESSTD